MKNKLKWLMISVAVVLLIVLTGMAFAASAPALNDSNLIDTYTENGVTYKVYQLADGRIVRRWSEKFKNSETSEIQTMTLTENAADDIVGTVNDEQKPEATLDSEYGLHYVSRDIAYYNNLYCVASSRNLDTFVLPYYNNNITYKASAVAEITGNTAVFYQIDAKGNKTKLSESTNEINNIIAGILTEKDPNSLVESINGNRIYKGNGAAITVEDYYTSEDYYAFYYRYTLKYSVTQLALWDVFNEWVGADNNAATLVGFAADASNDKVYEEYSNNYNDGEQEMAEKYIEKIKSSAKQYKATIYLLHNTWKELNTQSLILVETEDSTIDIPVTKIWEDNNNQYDTRPETINITLYDGDYNTIKTLTLSKENNWTGKFTELPVYNEDGKEIKYRVIEDTPKGYWQSGEGTKSNKYTIKNTLKTTDIEVQKNWVDGENVQNIRPTSIIVRLYRNGVATNISTEIKAENNWSATFENLPTYDKSGKKITYTVVEQTPSGYVSSEPVKETISESAKHVEIKFTITNTLQTIEIPVTKVWDDSNNVEGLRPDSVKVVLYENGVATTKTAELNESNNWKYTFTDLPEYKGSTKIEYTVQEEVVPNGYDVEITGDAEKGFTITNKSNITYTGYIEISGKVWLDTPNGKANEINGILDDDESGLEGIKVILKEESGIQFAGASTAITDSEGYYTIKVNYDNSKNVYKLYQDAASVQERLAKSYVEFQYDAIKYTTVATVKDLSGTMSNTSKAVENETERTRFDRIYAQVTAKTQIPSQIITANTKQIISFGTYSERANIIREETLKYCNGDGTYTQTNPNGAWLTPLEGEINESDHNVTCNGTGHSIRTYGINVLRFQNVNLGLFEREEPDVAIFSDITKVEVEMNNQQYTYIYGARSGELTATGGLQTKFQNKDTYTYRRPVNPADIAYINSANATGNEMKVKVTYEVKLANLSTTLPVIVHNIKNYYDPRYTLDTAGWTVTSGAEFNTATPNKNINISLQPGTESDAIELTYTVSLDAIKDLLNENATLNNAVEIQSYSTIYGEKTLYAEQRTGGRTGNPYAGYDYDSHPGNAGIYINEQGILAATNLEDDTDFAPSFVLCKDENYHKILSGNVWEDSDANSEDGYRLGDGKKSDTDNNVENVKVELYKINDDGSLEIAKLHHIDKDTAEVKTKDAIAYTNSEGYYAFGDENYSVVTDTYVIKFTYGTGIDGSISSSIDSVNISARDYKSTIISTDSNIYPVIKGIDTSDEWHLNINKGYSIAVDNIEERTAISDLQYSNFNDSVCISAWSKPFTMQVEFNPSEQKNSNVGVEGITAFGNELNVFDFGIIERAREDVFVNTTIDYLKITLANGQVLTEGNPQTDDMNYAKLVGFQQNINSGSAARRAIEKQLIMEMDTELIQGAQLEVRYQISVTNNSEKDIDCYVNNEYKTEFYYFGTNNENSPEITESVNKVITYMDAELTYTWEDESQWSQVSANELKDQGYISEATYKAIANNEYLMYVTNTASNLQPGQTNNYIVTARKLLANGEENAYDIQAEILEMDAKTARTTWGKQYKMGNYVPSLAARVINTDINLEKAGLHEQDDDRLKIVITPPTGDTNYIMNYIITGLISLIVIGIAVMFIKKKVLTK